MFAKLSTLALLLPLVSALTINPLPTVTSQGSATITWSGTTSDPQTFSIELVNTAFHNSYAIANNVVTANGQITLTIPEVPAGDGYSIQFVAVNNINQVYSQTGDFAIGAVTTPSTTAASTSSSATTSSSGTDTTPTASSTTPVSSVSSSPTASSASVSTATSSSAASPSSFSSSGAASLKLIGVFPAAVLALSAVAGAAMLF